MHLDLTNTWIGYLVLAIFVVWYYFIAREEKYQINKAKPALFIWTFSFLLIWIYFLINGLDIHLLNYEIEKLIIEISEIFFFLLVAMTFIEVMVDRWVFNVLRKKLVNKWYSYKISIRSVPYEGYGFDEKNPSLGWFNFFTWYTD